MKKIIFAIIILLFTACSNNQAIIDEEYEPYNLKIIKDNYVYILGRPTKFTGIFYKEDKKHKAKYYEKYIDGKIDSFKAITYHDNGNIYAVVEYVNVKTTNGIIYNVDFRKDHDEPDINKIKETVNYIPVPNYICYAKKELIEIYDEKGNLTYRLESFPMENFLNVSYSSIESKKSGFIEALESIEKIKKDEFNIDLIYVNEQLKGEIYYKDGICSRIIRYTGLNEKNIDIYDKYGVISARFWYVGNYIKEHRSYDPYGRLISSSSIIKNGITRTFHYDKYEEVIRETYLKNGKILREINY